jgi:hypothetical protein
VNEAPPPVTPELRDITHNAAFKIALLDFLFETKVGAGWAFSDVADNALKDLWEAAAGAVQEADRRDPAGLEALRIYEDQGYWIRIIRCPEPDSIAENYFVAIAWKPPRRHILPWKKTTGEVRYLALEYTLGEGGPATVLGEWTDEAHINYGPGPQPTEEAFVMGIRPILAERAEAAAISTLPPRP